MFDGFILEPKFHGIGVWRRIIIYWSWVQKLSYPEVIWNTISSELFEESNLYCDIRNNTPGIRKYSAEIQTTRKLCWSRWPIDGHSCSRIICSTLYNTYTLGLYFIPIGIFQTHYYPDKHIDNWELIRQKNQAQVDYNGVHKNMSRIDYD